MFHRAILSASIILTTAGLAAAGDNFVGVVPGQANIFGAGHADAPDPNGGGGGVLPTGFNINPGSNDYLQFNSVAGQVGCCGPGLLNGPDGGPFASGDTNVDSFGGISGLRHDGATMFLVGVFIGADEPADPAPERLDFTSNTSFTELSPALNQSFFIGDGYTIGTALGGGAQPHRFNIPAGATRLYLGFVDAFDFGSPFNPPGFYNDNVGELQVDFFIAPAPGAASVLLLGAAPMLRRRR